MRVTLTTIHSSGTAPTTRKEVDIQVCDAGASIIPSSDLDNIDLRQERGNPVCSTAYGSKNSPVRHGPNHWPWLSVSFLARALTPQFRRSEGQRFAYQQRSKDDCSCWSSTGL